MNTTIKTRWTLVIASLLVAPALLTGCSTDATKNEPTPKAESGTSYAACMRDKGYDEKDPSADSFDMKVPDGVDPEQYQSDVQACLGKSSGSGAGVEPKESEQDAAEARKEAACVREKGFPDFPDDPTAKYEPADPEAFVEAAESCGATSGKAGA